MKSKHGRSFAAYTSIPFAKPPLGNLRFKKPEPMLENAWTGTRDGSQTIPVCFQMSPNPWLMKHLGQEDCLYLNVYVPQVDKVPKDGFPVMAWIHGGGFVAGDSTDMLYGPQSLMDKDVILVKMNYRLGIMGFLSLGNDDFPGNIGLWDQVAGLKWIQKNIGAFNGNPGKVTIFGESAGAWCINYLLVSKHSKGLFHAAIVQSGALDQGTLKTEMNMHIPSLHSKYVKKVGCESSSSGSVGKCLQNLSLDQLYEHYFMFNDPNCNSNS